MQKHTSSKIQGKDASSKGKSEAPPPNFIRNIIEDDFKTNKFGRKVATRFPPEPNGYLHIGHAKSICLNFGLATENNGTCNLRFDDTNPSKENVEYVDAIQQDVRWLGFDWGERRFFASDYFEQLYAYACRLIEKGKAYVDSLNAEEIRTYRGTLTEAGKNSPNRTRSIQENLDLFQGMRKGEFEDGAHVLRAKIDMAHPNLLMRDPTLYRIRRVSHHRTGDDWCIYPMYDFTHCLSDSLEGITHSLCTLEFENNRQLYDWILDELDVYHPQQIEFARLNLSYTVLSKRRLIQLVEEKHVSGWDDPRMLTISGLKRRGYTPEAIRNFCERIGVARRDSMVEMALLEYTIREDLNKKAPRVMGVLNPLRVIIDNYPEGQVEELAAENNPEDAGMGSRKLPFSRELFIEKEDFMEEPPKKFFRLGPGREVRLKHAYYITCNHVEKDAATGAIQTLHCSYDPKTRGGWSDDGRRVKGTLHWVSVPHALKAEIRLFEYLFSKENPNDLKEGEHFTDYLNPDSLKVLRECYVEPSLAAAKPGSHYQFLRQGYFCIDTMDSTEGHPIFNRIVTLRDTWAKIQKSNKR